MNFVERFRSDFAQEMKSTRPVIERVPGERVEWRPHPDRRTSLLLSVLRLQRIQ